MKKIIIAVSTLLISLSACTDNEMSKKYGGTSQIKLEQGRKLVNITWKEDDLWVLTAPMTQSDSARILIFEEKSSWGIIEGKVVIKEEK
jgi:uncharacterized lipoprotein YehR (DUF1307 family)